MMFGWVGLACKKEFGLHSFTAIILSLISGVFAMLASGLIFNLARKLRSTGTVFNLDQAIGLEAFVYQRIPQGGVGKISVSLGDLTHEIDAISLQGEEIASFASVQIVKKADDKTLVVVSKAKP